MSTEIPKFEKFQSGEIKKSDNMIAPKKPELGKISDIFFEDDEDSDWVTDVTDGH